MKQDVPQGKVILALKDAIEDTFNAGKWLELGLLTDTSDLIRTHPRLLRSLAWGDDDYSEKILEVLPSVLGEKRENLGIVEEFVGFESWLRSHNPPLHAELYGDGANIVEDIEGVGKLLNVQEVNQQVARIRRSIHDDAALAVGSAKELLESIMLGILAEEDVEVTRDEDITSLLKKVQGALNLDPRTSRVDELLKRTLSNLGQVVIGVAELRNLAGTGHGRIGGPQLDDVHARLVVNAASTVCIYLVEVWRSRNQAKKA